MLSSPSRFVTRLGIYVLAALAVALVLHGDLIRRMSAATPEKAGVALLGPRTDFGDNYHYYSYAKGGLSTCTDPGAGGNPLDKANGISCTFAGALVVSHAIHAAGTALAPSSRHEPAMTLVLHTAFLALALVVCISVLLDRPLPLGAATAVAAAVLFTVGNFALTFYFGMVYKYFGSLLSGEPDIFRILNPTTFWALGLFTMAALANAIRRPSAGALLVCCVSSLFLGTASIAVAGTLLAGIGLHVLVTLVAERRWCLPSLLTGAVLFAGLVAMLALFRLYWSTEVGQSFNHGKFLRLSAKPAFLFLLAPVFVGRMAPDGGRVGRLLKCLLVAAAGVGMFSDSVEYGGRLWLRGAVIVAIACWAAWLSATAMHCWTWVATRWRQRTGQAPAPIHPGVALFASIAIAAAACLALSSAMHKYRPWDPLGWRGYMESGKLGALEWLDAHARPGDLVASTDIGDAYVVPFYTRAKAFAPVYGLTPMPPLESARRYLGTVALVRGGDQRVAGILSMPKKEIEAHVRFLMAQVAAPYGYEAFQRVAFYESLLYIPYNASFQGIFDPGPARERFLALFTDGRRAVPPACGGFDYLVLRDAEEPVDPGAYVVSYRNGAYKVLQPRQAPASRCTP